MPHLAHNKRGFIAIVALGIFMLLSIFGIIVQRTTITTINNIRITNDYYRASDIADGVLEYMQKELAMHEAGYNFETSCAFGDVEDTEEPDNPYNPDPKSICTPFQDALNIGNENIKISMRIMGRSDEPFTGACPGLWTDCYVVPIAGMGSAGERCDLYEPSYDVANMIGHNGQVTTSVDGIPELDYSCNWNKLTYGSSSTDRAAIPFYFDPGGIEEIVNPFNDYSPPEHAASTFAIRFRAPCLPCEDRGGCSGADETICDNTERYELNTLDGNEVAAQWQLSGECGLNNEECGLVQVVIKNNDEIDELTSHAITENRVNNNGGEPYYTDNIVLSTDSKGYETEFSSSAPVEILEKLRSVSNPIMSFFIGGNLISYADANIPYLEYQVLTDQPIGNSSTFAVVSVNVNGYVFEKTLAIEQDKPLIDFAVQN